MWNPGDRTNNTFPAAPAHEQPKAATAPAIAESGNGSSAGKAQSQAVIGRSIVVKGEITGKESLHIDGRIEGSIELPGNYVHVGPDALVMSNITARQLVVRGTLGGNATLDDQLDIRSGGSLTGNVTARRVSIADGAYFKGSIDMRRTEPKVSLGDPTQSNVKKDVAPVLNRTEVAPTGS